MTFHNPHHPNRCLSREDLAEYTGISLRSIDNFVNAGDLPEPGRFGTKPYWMLHALEQFLTERMPSQEPAPVTHLSARPTPAKSKGTAKPKAGKYSVAA